MAYTVLDNKAAILATKGKVTGSHSGRDQQSYQTGLMSPNGELLAIITEFRNGSTGNDRGVDIRKSGSEGNMDLVSSIPISDSHNVMDIVWVNNNELLISTDNSAEELIVATSSVGGTTFGVKDIINSTVGSNTANAWKLELCPDGKDRLLAYHDPGSGGDQYVWIFDSGSDGWAESDNVRITNAVSRDIYAVRWLQDKDHFAASSPVDNKVWIVANTGGLSNDGWPSYAPSAPATQVQQITGSDSNSYLGQALEWHTGSNSLVLFTNAKAEIHVSSSQGYSGKNQPAFVLTGSSFDNASGGLIGYSSKIYKNSIFYRLDATYHDTLTRDTVFVLENGSNTGGYPGGWRAELFTGSGQAQIYNSPQNNSAANQVMIGAGILALTPPSNHVDDREGFFLFDTGLGLEGADDSPAGSVVSTKVDSKQFQTSAFRKAAIASGSVEVGHLSFRDTANGKFLVDLADGDVLAVQDSSNSTDTPMRGLKLSDLKNYISASEAGGRTGSLQFNPGDSSHAGVLTITSDGTNLTASGGSKIYFGKSALGTSAKSVSISSQTDKILDLVASDTGSGKIVVHGGLAVKLRAAGNDGLTVGQVAGFPVLMDGRDNGDASHRANIRFNEANSAPAVTIFSGSTPVFGTRVTDVMLSQSNAKLYFDNGTTYYVGSTSNVQFLTASQAKFDSLEVTEIVSRSTTKNSLEIRDNLVIAAVSGTSPGDHIGAGFQLGGKVGVEGTGSSPLFSITLGDSTVGKGSIVLNVAGTRIASVTSGSFYKTHGDSFSGQLAVTGAVSASLAVAHKAIATAVTGAGRAIYHDLTIGGSLKGTINHHNIRSGSIVTGHVVDNVATTAKINDSAVTTAKILDSNVTTAKIVDDAVTTATINNSNVTTAKIADAGVTHAKLGIGSARPDNLGTGSVYPTSLTPTVVQNNSDAHGGISYTNGRLSIGFVKKVFGLSTSHFITDAVADGATTASLSAQPVSGTIQVYRNGILLAPEHFAGPGPQNAASTQADYRIVTSSANNHALHLHPELAFTGSTLLVVTFLSASGITS